MRQAYTNPMLPVRCVALRCHALHSCPCDALHCNALRCATLPTYKGEYYQMKRYKTKQTPKPPRPQPTKRTINIVDSLEDKLLLGAGLGAPSTWSRWLRPCGRIAQSIG